MKSDIGDIFDMTPAEFSEYIIDLDRDRLSLVAMALKNLLFIYKRDIDKVKEDARTTEAIWSRINADIST
jgi:hypothetical protein